MQVHKVLPSLHKRKVERIVIANTWLISHDMNALCMTNDLCFEIWGIYYGPVINSSDTKQTLTRFCWYDCLLIGVWSYDLVQVQYQV